MAFTPILATLGYILSKDRARVLFIHRDKRPEDHHLGKYNGLGGKVDPGEDVAAAMAREVREEAGLEIQSMALRGTISWPGFGKNGEDWFGFIFLIDGWTGTPLTTNPEGTLEWVPRERILDLPLWEGDRFFLPMVFENRQGQFHGVMPYENGKPARWSYSWLDASKPFDERKCL